jgi:hypothetical protein
MNLKIQIRDELICLKKAKLEQISGDFYKAEIGIQSLLKLGIGVVYEKVKGLGWQRNVYSLIRITPAIQNLMRDRPHKPKNGIIQYHQSYRAATKAMRLRIVVYLKQITRKSHNLPPERFVYAFAGCDLVHVGKVVDSILPEGKSDGNEERISGFLCTMHG